MSRLPLLLVLAAGCSFEADYSDTSFQCDPSDGCPAGYHCDVDTCVADGTDPADEVARRIVVAAGKVEADLVKYPLLVSTGPDADLAAHAREDGADLRFADIKGDPLPYEIEAWDPATGALVAWVSVPLVRASDDTELLLLYGGPPMTSNDPTVVWSAFAGVWHFAALGTTDDATGRGVDGAASDGPYQADERIGQAARLAGGFIHFGDPADGHLDFDDDDELTLSIWIRIDELTENFQLLINKGGSNDSTPGYTVETAQDNSLTASCVGDGLVSRCTPYGEMAAIGTWTLHATVLDRQVQHLRVVRDGANLVTNGDDLTGFSAGGADNDNPLRVGANFAGAYRWPGAVDELRVARTALPAAWLRADHDSQRAGADFVTIGDEEPAP